MEDAVTHQIKPLKPLDKFHFEAAQGWLALGNYTEADAELDRIEAKNRAHPDVLKVRCLIAADAEKWDACLEIATALNQLTPDWLYGWIHRADSLDKLGRSAEAKDVLLEAMNKLGPDAKLAFHLACICARHGKMVEARAWIQKAVELAEDNETLDRLRLLILDEPILEPIGRALVIEGLPPALALVLFPQRQSSAWFGLLSG